MSSIIYGPVPSWRLGRPGYTLTEEFVIYKDNGGLESNSLTTYKMPSFHEMPETLVILVR